MRTPKPAEESLSQVPRVTTKEIARRVEEPCSDRAGDVPQQPAADTKTTPPFQPRPIVFYLFPSVQNPSWTHRVGLVRDQLDTMETRRKRSKSAVYKQRMVQSIKSLPYHGDIIDVLYAKSRHGV